MRGSSSTRSILIAASARAVRDGNLNSMRRDEASWKPHETAGPHSRRARLKVGAHRKVGKVVGVQTADWKVKRVKPGRGTCRVESKQTGSILNRHVGAP